MYMKQLHYLLPLLISAANILLISPFQYSLNVTTIQKDDSKKPEP